MSDRATLAALVLILLMVGALAWRSNRLNDRISAQREVINSSKARCDAEKKSIAEGKFECCWTVERTMHTMATWDSSSWVSFKTTRPYAKYFSDGEDLPPECEDAHRCKGKEGR